MALNINEFKNSMLKKSEYEGIKNFIIDKGRNIPYENLFSRVCSINYNQYAQDPIQFYYQYYEIYGKYPTFKLEPNEDHDPLNYLNSTNVMYKVQIGNSKSSSNFDTFKLCPLCEMNQSNDKKTNKSKLQPKLPGFYKTNNCEYEKHMSFEHGVLKNGSIIPQPFVGYSKSNRYLYESDKHYKLSIICPYQHLNLNNGEIVQSCNAIFQFSNFKNITTPYKEYFQHFSINHLNAKSNEQIIKNVIARHISKPKNIFYPICQKSHDEVIQYQQKRCPNSWKPTMTICNDEIIKCLESLLVKPGVYSSPNVKERFNLSYNDSSRIILFNEKNCIKSIGPGKKKSKKDKAKNKALVEKWSYDDENNIYDSNFFKNLTDDQIAHVLLEFLQQYRD
ncbi:hypothetical protein BN7_2862 [Wickerhamomyces ciferrii]|uniref:Transcription regulator Rua1 C-terminal domain-containing protein n=1 Tax=Wickerhamomyces ciferrii (strain ATCC 14091 / BCRC 22168 / CBS 111 / JCM 3599 / NBRC 0793 / NRRL Y-1031 F-60-10) TaxID=1206466 RepID=K0KPL7_WICCF|nr:uncharacterized protein BN7_2862 [Wickerhamomyces ciferrii]CCH43314.1 hypothetical protein BN7_2862 [Wickerhamomyces ciferrii]